MLENQTILITILKQVIKDTQTQIEKIDQQSNSSMIQMRELMERLKKNYEEIIHFSEEDIKNILNTSALEETEKNQLTKSVLAIRTLIELNKTKKTTFKVTEQQIQKIHDFCTIIEQIDQENKRKSEQATNMIAELTKKQNRYIKLLGIIEDDKNQDFIKDLSLVEELFQVCVLEEETKRKILLNIMQYNESVYLSKLNKEESKRLNIEEVKYLFEIFNYDFSSLKEEDQEDILNYGNLDNIKDIMVGLSTLGYPRFNLKRDGHKLVLLLINGNMKTIQEITEYSKSKGIYPQNLLMMLPALIEQTKENKGEKTIIDNPNSYVTGRSRDYKENIEFLEGLGFRMAYIFNKCKEVLIMNHEKLLANYEKFLMYGFSFKQDIDGELTHPALTCLISSNFEEIVDQFIEVSRDGHQYIKENQSRIMNISSADDIVFYNIYASYLNEDDLGEKLIAEGPFVNGNKKKLNLRGEITRYSGSGYETTPYRGITEETKNQKTMTIIPHYEDEEKFLEAIKKSKNTRLYDLTVNDERLEALEQYTDQQDPIRYDFNGIRISKPKVKRIMNNLKNYGLDSLEDSLLFAITYHSIISQENFDKIKELIKGWRK